MSTAAHTAGPWKTSPHGDGYLVTREDVFVAGHSICGVRPSQAANEDQCEANARLIAAAPDLLAACRVLANLGEANIASDIKQALRFVERVSFDKAIAAARAAIARAEGKS